MFYITDKLNLHSRGPAYDGYGVEAGRFTAHGFHFTHFTIND